MRLVRILNSSRPQTEPIIAQYCESYFEKLRGLMFRRHLLENHGLLLVYRHDSRVNTAIHMLGMRMDITTVWINLAGKVVDVCLAQRWRLSYFPQSPASYVLEAHPARYMDFRVGDQIQIVELQFTQGKV